MNTYKHGAAAAANVDVVYLRWAREGSKSNHKYYFCYIRFSFTGYVKMYNCSVG